MKIRQNPLSEHVAFACVRCLVGHKVGKDVTERRVALAKKTGKKQKMGEGEGKLLENCGRKGNKRREGKRERSKKKKNWRKKRKGRELEEKGGKGRTREKGRLGSPESRRPVTRFRKRRWNFACHVPSTFARKAAMFEPPRKKTQKCGKKARKMHI